MITMIIYINEDGIVDSNYKRILGFDIINSQINLLAISRTYFLGHEEQVFRDVSEWTCTSREWKLILVDDARVACSQKAENCQKNCTHRNRNAYSGFEFSEQIKVLSGHKENPSYTAVPPQEFYLIRTRENAQPCPRDVAYDGNHVREVQGLPANIRYMVYDFKNRGDFCIEEYEWKLFFCLWLLARDETIVDWMDVYKIYRLEIDWDVFRLSDYIEELRQQLKEFQNELKSSEIPVKRKWDISDTNLNLKRDGGSKNLKGIHSREKIDRESCGKLLKYLRKTREEIEEQGYEAFREIRTNTRSIGMDLKGDSYEKVLKEHYERGNESFDCIEAEIRDLDRRLRNRKDMRRPILVPLLEAFMIIIGSFFCFGSLPENKFMMAAIMGIVFILTYFFSYLYTKKETDIQELTTDYSELSQKVDDIICKKFNWINIQFDKMKLYKAWTNQRYIQKCAIEKDNASRMQTLEYEAKIIDALAFCDKLDVFSKKNQVRGWSGYRYLGLETERFYYPAGWMERQCTCDVQGQNIHCPYYFLNQVFWRLEYGE